MKTINIVLITVVSIFVIIVAFGYFANNHQEHSRYCENWGKTIDQQRKILEDKLFSDWSEFNKDVNEYNRECAY